ncbi:MAG: hypothetical protein ACREOI_24570, partial [bacterium]
MASNFSLLAQSSTSISISSNQPRESTSSLTVSAAVPLEHPVYPFIEKLVALLPSHTLDLHVLPVDRQRVQKILSAAKTRGLPLSSADQNLLQQYLTEF